MTYTDETTSTFTVRNGTDGVGVEKIEKTASSADGLIDTYTITLTGIKEAAEPWSATFFIIDPELFGDDTIITDLR